MSPSAGSLAASISDPLIHYATEIAIGLTTTAALYVAQQARKVARKVERFDRVLFGDDRVDGRDGIANIALENERRSLENRETLNELEHAPKGATDARQTKNN